MTLVAGKDVRTFENIKYAFFKRGRLEEVRQLQMFYSDSGIHHSLGYHL